MNNNRPLSSSQEGEKKAMRRGETVPVLYVEKRAAKQIKVALEQGNQINKDFRMGAVVRSEGELQNIIAVPILLEQAGDGIDDSFTSWNGVVGHGTEFCFYSTSLLGNHAGRTANNCHSSSNNNFGKTTNLVEQALLTSVKEKGLLHGYKDDDKQDSLFMNIIAQMRQLDSSVCPKKLEYLGDDRTLVLSRKAFSLDKSSSSLSSSTFASFLEGCGIERAKQQEFVDEYLWKNLASTHKSPRVVRRGEIAPSSGIRESNYRLLWPFNGVPDVTGPGTPAWITVTEQGIRQSFDMTRVMFSRGNITEKIRFGQLLQRGDIVLDLYGGIGYFSLPALVHGEAEYLYACEWNPEAAKALRFNLSDNGVAERATVFEGDCRVQARKHNLVNMFDRVSLGLLPSSEGGWWTAVQALRRSTGGWLHIHGNVPVKEVGKWTVWLCRRLLEMSKELSPPPLEEWAVICQHVEKVKSFAPTVNHYVADVFLGNPADINCDDVMKGGGVGVIDKNGTIEKVDLTLQLDIPSCALSKDGVLCQDWMMEETES